MLYSEFFEFVDSFEGLVAVVHGDGSGGLYKADDTGRIELAAPLVWWDTDEQLKNVIAARTFPNRYMRG